MITFVLGASGSGKSHTLYTKAAELLGQGERVIMIVPEQQALDAERRIADMTQNGESFISTVNLEVLNFSRLANRVFRDFGGLSYNYINSGARALILWQALFDLSAVLEEYAGAAKEPLKFIPILSRQIKEFSDFAVTPSALEDAAEKLPDEEVSLKRKLSDLSMIYSAYSAILNRGFDDPQNDISKMNELLCENDFFDGCSVIIDSFDGFSSCELTTLEHIFSQSKSVYISLPYRENKDDPAFETINRLRSELYKLASRYCEPEQLLLTENHRANNPALKKLEAELWCINKLDYSEDTLEDIGDTIELIQCKNVFDEAETVARRILKKVQSGARYRDIVVITRDFSRYDGIIDTMLERYGIPFIATKRTDISSSPICKLISSAISVCCYGWRRKDVIAYMKTGMTNLSFEECDKLEKYVYTWNINGKRWIDEDEWTMHPDGYVAEMDESVTAQIDEINRIRFALTAPLQRLFSSFEQKRTAGELLTSLYEFLLELSIPDKIEGDTDAMQTWNALMDCFDQIHSVISDVSVTPAQFSVIFELVIKESSIGKLPETIDCVNVGSADHLRAERIKHAFVLGVNEGIFPASVKEGNIFSDKDKAVLSDVGINLSPVSSERTSDELYIMYKAFACPEDTLTVLASHSELSGEKLNPSLGYLRIKTIFPNIQPTVTDSITDPTELIWGYDASFEYAARYRGTPESKALMRIYLKDPLYLSRLEALETPIADEIAELDEETVKLIFPGNVAVTQSRLDSYVLCPFGYYCKYVLKLKENAKASFEYTDIGTFVHYILEKFLKRIYKDGKLDTALDSSEINALVDDIIESYLDAMFRGNESLKTNRTMQLIRRLKRAVIPVIENLLEEFSQSEFVPSFFELNISSGENAEESVPSLKIPLLDGTYACVYGIIDRVDTFKKGNDVYVRIVDYKTGSKTFSMSDIALGLNMQMLLYLFSIWQSNSSLIRNKVDASGDIIPAGVLYHIASPTENTYQNLKQPEDVLRAAGMAMKKSGLLLEDMEVLRAMDKALNGKYIPVKLQTNGFRASDNLESLENMGSLMREVTDKVASIVEEMKAGIANVDPMKEKGHDACEYCTMRSICRKIN